MSRMLRHLPCSALLLVTTVSGCQCIDPETFGNIRDAGKVVEPPAPDPPVFPLKQGDVLVFPGVGGRTSGGCGAAEGGCERTLRATYTIDSVTIDSETNRWTVNADYIYEMQTANIEEGEIGPLFLYNAADFSLEAAQATNGTAAFNTDGAPTEELTPNDVPFFHYETAYAGLEGSAFKHAAAEFTDRIKALDPDANIDAAPASAALEAYFKDDRTQPTMLHKMRVDFHPFGFMCQWDERLIPWQDDMQRNETDFNGVTAGLTAVFASPIRLVRGSDTFICNCSTLGKLCKLQTDMTQCLDPADPDAAPSACPE